jgi:hypothetical protein
MSENDLITDSRQNAIRLLVCGASYGILPGIRAAAAGHKATFVCRDEEADLIEAGNFLLRVPAKDCAVTLDIGAEDCRFAPRACAPHEVEPSDFDLVCLAMQEPQYSSAGVRSLVRRIVASRVPCVSIMNMPLPPYLSSVVALGGEAAVSIFTEPELWADMDSADFTMASADPQAMRLDADDMLITQVTLPTNFKFAPFANPEHQQKLERLGADIDRSRIRIDGAEAQPRVRLRPHESRFAPLAKWPMLITGNFRCMTDGAPVSIGEAVCSDEAESRELYDWVSRLCLALGAEDSTMVTFDAYRAAAVCLSLPSSLARGLYAGATAVERIDLLIQAIAADQGMSHAVLEAIVDDVSARLDNNRSKLGLRDRS